MVAEKAPLVEAGREKHCCQVEEKKRSNVEKSVGSGGREV